jgi:DNA replication protein DnaC
MKRDTVNKHYPPEEAIQRIYSALLKVSNIPPKFQDATFASFNMKAINSKNASKVKSLKNYADNILQAIQIPQSVYMFSEYNGCGKTHLAVAILKRAAWQFASEIYRSDPLKYGRRGVSFDNFSRTPVFFMSEKNYIYKKKLAFSTDDKAIKDEVEWIERMVIKSDLLVIDDFFKERNTDFTFNEMTSWICLRYEQNKPVIFTSNMDFTELAMKNEKNPYYNTDNFKNATYLASRLSEMTKGYKFFFYSSPEEDFRQKEYSQSRR